MIPPSIHAWVVDTMTFPISIASSRSGILRGAGPAIQAADHTGRGEFHIGSDKAFPDFIKRQKWGAIVLDPPRVGAKHSMEILQNADTDRIIYISCDPATLARDASVLLKGHWKINSVTAIDIFPNTNHIETVCVFDRKADA